jgi:hypothetical protein
METYIPTTKLILDLEKANSQDEFNLEAGEHVDQSTKDNCWKWMKNFVGIFIGHHHSSEYTRLTK